MSCRGGAWIEGGAAEDCRCLNAAARWESKVHSLERVDSANLYSAMAAVDDVYSLYLDIPEFDCEAQDGGGHCSSRLDILPVIDTKESRSRCIVRKKAGDSSVAGGNKGKKRRIVDCSGKEGDELGRNQEVAPDVRNGEPTTGKRKKKRRKHRSGCVVAEVEDRNTACCADDCDKMFTEVKEGDGCEERVVSRVYHHRTCVENSRNKKMSQATKLREGSGKMGSGDEHLRMNDTGDEEMVKSERENNPVMLKVKQRKLKKRKNVGLSGDTMEATGRVTNNADFEVREGDVCKRNQVTREEEGNQMHELSSRDVGDDEIASEHGVTGNMDEGELRQQESKKKKKHKEKKRTRNQPTGEEEGDQAHELSSRDVGNDEIDSAHGMTGNMDEGELGQQEAKKKKKQREKKRTHNQVTREEEGDQVQELSSRDVGDDEIASEHGVTGNMNEGELGQQETKKKKKQKAKKRTGSVSVESKNSGVTNSWTGTEYDANGSAPASEGDHGPLSTGTPGIVPGKRPGILEKMRAHLIGGQFRMLNEKLYTSRGDEALNTFKKNPSLFFNYHAGYQAQMSQWPKLPVEVMEAWLRARGASLTVADFGCGDARLAKSLPNKVYSFDLVAACPEVVACNMAKTPLDDASVDVAVFCLSLMGVNYGDYLREAHRVLKDRGWLLIAEVKSRFDPAHGGPDPELFIKALSRLGLKLTKKDDSNKMFLWFELQKVNSASEERIKWPRLKACVYKKR